MKLSRVDSPLTDAQASTYWMNRFFLTGEFIREKVLIVGEDLHIALHLLVLLKAASLWVDIAVVEFFYEICHGSFFFDLLRNPCAYAVKM